MRRILRSWQETLRSVREGLGLRSKTPAAERYHVFIAYSWSDASLAAAVQVGLERLAKPWHRTRALRVFRDSTGLPAGPGLRKSLLAALDNSDYLVLIASRASAASEHVRREIEHWQRTKGVANLLIGLAEGDLQWGEERGDYSDGSWTVLPESLRGAFAEEPLYADFTDMDPKELTLDHNEFRDAVRLLAAGPHGMEPADLAGLEVAERRRTTLYARSAGLVLVALTILAIAAGVVAIVQRDNAIDQSRVALSRQIATEAEGVRTTQPDLALLLGVQALRTAETAEARSGLLGSLLAESRIVRFLYGPRSPVLAMAYVGTGDSELITVHRDGEVVDWNTRRGTGRPIARLGPIEEALVADSIAAVLRGTGRLDVYQLSASAPGAPTKLFSASPRVRCEPHKLSACYEGLLNAMSPDGRWLVTDLEGTHLELWEVEQGQLAPRQPPRDLGAPSVISEYDEQLVAVRHHYVNSYTEPNAPSDELLSWPLEGGRPRVLARLKSTQYLDGPLVVEDSESRAVVAAELQNLLTFTQGHPSQARPVLTTGPPSQDSAIVSLLPLTDEIIYLNSSGTLGVVDSLNHTNSRIVSQVDTLVEQAHGAPIQHRLAMSLDPTELAVAGGSQGLLLLNSPDWSNGSWLLAGTPLGYHLDETPEHFSEQSPSSLPVFSPDGSVLAATTDGSEGLALWRAGTGATAAAFESGYGSSPIRVAKISVAPDDHTVAFITKPRVSIEPEASQAPPAGISFTGSVRIWDWRAASHPRVLAIPFTRGDGPTAVAFAAKDPQHLVVGTGLGRLYFWDPRTGTQWRAPIRLPLTTPAPVVLLGAEESGRLLVGVAGGHLLTWDERTGLLTPAPSPKGAIADALSPSGQLAAGIDSVGDMKIWNTQTGRAVPGELLAPSYIGSLTSLTLGDGLLALTSNGAVTLYDTATLRKVGQVEVPAGAPEVAFSPTRQALAVVNGVQGSVLAIDPKSLASRACAIANRELTRAEWAQFVGSALPYSATCHMGAPR